MISIAKEINSLPELANFLIDTGNNLIVGGRYFNKDLTPALATECYSPAPFNGPLTFPLTYTNSAAQSRLYVGYQGWISPLYLRGNNTAAYWSVASGAGTQKGQPPASAQTIQQDVYSPYFDSTVGATAGNRYLMLPRVTLCQVKGNGGLTQLATLTNATDTAIDSVYAGFGDYSTIIGENLSSFYVLRCFPSGLTSIYPGNFALLKIAKADFSYTQLTSAATATSTILTGAGQRMVRFMGITDDNKALFAVTPQGPASVLTDNVIFYWILDLSAGTLATSSTALTVGTSNVSLVNVGYSVSSLTADLQDATSRKFYYPIIAQAAATATTISRARVPKVIGTKVNPVAGDVVACTLTGLPAGVTIPNCSTDPINAGASDATAQTTLLTLVNNGKEYLIVINHAASYYSLTNTQTVKNSCDTTKACVFVFLVDPLDSSNLIYKQSLFVADLSGSIFFGVNASLDRSLLVLSGLTSMITLKWNSTNEQYTVGKTINIPGNVQRVSVDDQSQIWVEDGANKLFVFQLDNSIDVNIVYEGGATSVNYSGTPVQINLVVNTFNMSNARVAKTVNLNIQGGVFTSSGTANVQVTTSAVADTLVNITINTSGQVVVTPTSVV